MNIALPRLPPEVQRQGVVVKKVSSAFLMVIGLISPDDRYDSLFLTNYAQINLLNQIGSLPGVGESRLSSQQVYSMRVWVDPDKMSKLGLTATDVNNAINCAEPAESGGRPGSGACAHWNGLSISVSAPGRLVDPEQFGDIVLRAQPDASLLRIRDIGKVQLGSLHLRGFQPDEREAVVQRDRVSVAGRECGGNARTRSMRSWSRPRRVFQPGSTTRLRTIRRVSCARPSRTWCSRCSRPVGLVILVVFIFLQNWRATLIPLLTVPVAVIGAIALFPLLGFSINITSMFGLVLSIGIVVDDAIVVVEAVQRNIDDGMAPREATLRAMQQVSAPVVAIACILAAVFIPVAFLGGISGQIYRQFALTIASSVLLSAFSALSLSPALSSLLLKPHNKIRAGRWRTCFGKFNRAFEWATNRYLAGVGLLIRRCGSHSGCAGALLGCRRVAVQDTARGIPAG